MRKLLLLAFLFATEISAINIIAEQIVITHENSKLYGLSIKNENNKRGKICKTITVNKYYKSVEQLGLFLEIKNPQKDVVFSGLIAGQVDENPKLINYYLCYQDSNIVFSGLLTYGYRNNGLTTAFFDIGAELIAP